MFVRTKSLDSLTCNRGAWGVYIGKPASSWIERRIGPGEDRLLLKSATGTPGCGGKLLCSTLPQFPQQYKLVPGYRQWWMCERFVFAQ